MNMNIDVDTNFPATPLTARLPLLPILTAASVLSSSRPSRGELEHVGTHLLEKPSNKNKSVMISNHHMSNLLSNSAGDELMSLYMLFWSEGFGLRGVCGTQRDPRRVTLAVLQ